jgi:N-acetylglucosamine-6-phosphate deacetylase
MVGLIVDGIHAHPAIVRLIWQAKGSRGITLVTDAMAALGMEDGLYHLGNFDVTVLNGSARLANGTLAGSIVRHDEELRNLMAFTGCSLAEALFTFTSNPARLLGLTDRGKIEPGWIADLVLLTPDGHVQRTFVKGEEV